MGPQAVNQNVPMKAGTISMLPLLISSCAQRSMQQPRCRTNITVTAYWVRWRPKSVASRLFARSFVLAPIKENTKALRYWPLWPVVSPHKGPVTWKMFPFDDVIMKMISNRHRNLCNRKNCCEQTMCEQENAQSSNKRLCNYFRKNLLCCL